LATGRHRPTKENEVLPGDWTALIASELVAELRRRDERRRLNPHARTRPSGGSTPPARSARRRGRVGLIQAAHAWQERRLQGRGARPLGQGGEQA
jgi:hypothetical protein